LSGAHPTPGALHRQRRHGRGGRILPIYPWAARWVGHGRHAQLAVVGSIDSLQFIYTE